MNTLLEPFGYEFFQRALLVATITGALCGLIGVYVVLRGMSYIGHGLSHAIFGGAVASYIVGVNVFLGRGSGAGRGALHQQGGAPEVDRGGRGDRCDHVGELRGWDHPDLDNGRSW